MRLVQDELDAPSTPLLRGGEPMTFGHYQVVDPRDYRVPPGCDRGLLIHYGLGRNRSLDLIGRLRDPIVALEPRSVELLLGWSYVDCGLFNLKTPSYFTLEREGRLTQRVTPPRR